MSWYYVCYQENPTLDVTFNILISSHAVSEGKVQNRHAPSVQKVHLSWSNLLWHVWSVDARHFQTAIEVWRYNHSHACHFHIHTCNENIFIVCLCAIHVKNTLQESITFRLSLHFECSMWNQLPCSLCSKYAPSVWSQREVALRSSQECWSDKEK